MTEMTGKEFGAIIDALFDHDLRAAAFLDAHRATIWRWRVIGPPLPVARLLRLMVRRGILVMKVEEQTAKPVRIRRASEKSTSDAE